MALAACGGGGGSGGQPTGPVTISGKAQYEFPPPLPACQGLDFGGIQLRPVRQATIQLIDATTNAVLGAGVTGDDGDFSLTVDPDTDVFIRVRAELKKAGTPSWDVEVRDNTADAVNTPLAQRALYVLDGALFNSGSVNLTRDITAATGWTGTSYTGTRAAAPFAVLDAIYSGMLLIVAEDPQVAFEPLDAFWSVNNTATPGDIDIGEIGTSFYSGNNELFLLGKVGVDADEFDDHVVAHEWGHYFEDTFSRSDSVGGSHGLGDLLDMRVAFGEGWATALSGISLGNPLYCDTTLSGGFGINIEGQGGGTPGWYNEISVMKLIFDLWDTNVDGADTGSIGFGPLYGVMTGAEATTPAFTSIFTFATALKAENPASEPFIDALLLAEAITAAGMNAFGDGELNQGPGNESDVLPVYTDIVPDGTMINICSNSQFDRSSIDELIADGNKLSEHRFLRMTIGTPSQYAFDVRTKTPMPAPDDPNDDRDQSDPDILIVLNGQAQNQFVNGDLQGFSGAANEEIFTTANILAAGEYVMDLVEFRYQDDQTPANYPPQTCFDVTVGPAP